MRYIHILYDAWLSHVNYLPANMPSQTSAHTGALDVSDYIPVETFIPKCRACGGFRKLGSVFELLRGELQANENITFMFPQSD